MSIAFVGSESASQELILPQGSSTTYGQLKVETALLLRKVNPSLSTRIVTSAVDVEVMAFGDAAELRYASMESVERENVCFVSHFKMELYSSKKEDNDPILTKTSSGGFQVSLSVPLTKSLEVMKTAAINYLCKTSDPNISPSAVLWVITIPAIWNERMAHTMRERAFDAKIISELDSSNLILCLEPEGVCFCAIYPESEFMSKLLLTKKTQFIVLDAGEK